MKLYFDIGNTNIKLTFNKNNQDWYFSFQTDSKHTVDSLYKSLPDEIKHEKIESIWIVSVIPSTTLIIEGLSKKYFGVKPKIFSYPLKTRVKLNVENPKEVGADLVAIASYASHLGNNIIVVNLGTATTITHIKDNELKGVIISLGLMAQLDSLVEKTSKLSEISLIDTNNAIGKNTVESISIGVLNGHVEMIKALISKIDKDAKVIISGGHARKILKMVDYEFIKEITLEGLKHIEKINNN